MGPHGHALQTSPCEPFTVPPQTPQGPLPEALHRFAKNENYPLSFFSTSEGTPFRFTMKEVVL